MDQYLIYLLIVIVTVASPGPGVVLTLSNAIRYGIKPAMVAVLGIALGIFIIASASATSLGVLLAASSLAFTIIKFIGAAYLIYLGVKLWRAPSLRFADIGNASLQEFSYGKRFKEGFLVTLLNPKPIFFFMSLFPQFINAEQSYASQFSLLTITFCSVIIIVHFLYAVGANSIKAWLLTPKGSKMINKASGSVFILFGLGLASSHR